MKAPRWARGANMRKAVAYLDCDRFCLLARPLSTGSMSGVQAAGSPAGTARVQSVGHRSTDSISKRQWVLIPLFFFQFVADGEKGMDKM